MDAPEIGTSNPVPDAQQRKTSQTRKAQAVYQMRYRERCKENMMRLKMENKLLRDKCQMLEKALNISPTFLLAAQAMWQPTLDAAHCQWPIQAHPGNNVDGTHFAIDPSQLGSDICTELTYSSTSAATHSIIVPEWFYSDPVLPSAENH